MLQGGGARSLFHMAEQGTSLQHTNLSCIVQWAQLYILTDRMGPLTPDLFLSGAVMILHYMDCFDDCTINYNNELMTFISNQLGFRLMDQLIAE